MPCKAVEWPFFNFSCTKWKYFLSMSSDRTVRLCQRQQNCSFKEAMYRVCSGESTHWLKIFKPLPRETPCVSVWERAHLQTGVWHKNYLLYIKKKRKATAGREKTIITKEDTDKEKIKKERVPEWNLSWGQPRSLLCCTFAPVSYRLIIARLLFSKELSDFFFWCLSVFSHSNICCCVALYPAKLC